MNHQIPNILFCSGDVGERLNSQHVIQVATGASHSAVLTQNHKVLTWGKNTEGQLGRGDVEESSRGTPTIVKSLSAFCVLQVACGDNHTVILTQDGQVATWGSNSFGQLGLGATETLFIDEPRFLDCLKGLPIDQVASGSNHSLILSKSGAVYGWGRNSFGQLGLNNKTDCFWPNQCRPLRSQKIKYICCGKNHTACLTMDGGVFTFGAGTCGQLGHGSYNNEYLPKQVIELSKSEVTQIACGRCHTLAFVAKSGRIYTFGLGVSGQLGLSTTENKNTPVFIAGPIVSGSTQTVSMVPDKQSSEIKVKRIYAGGDHSFAIVQEKAVCQPDDYRIKDPTKQILSLSQRSIEKLQSYQKEQIPSEMTHELSTIFSSVSCLNGSFLLLDEEHNNTTSLNHGVNMNAVKTFFHTLENLSTADIIQKLSMSIEKRLYPSLAPSPPDVEALRVYLILPECHLFNQPALYSSIICPFAKSLLSLSKVALDKIKSWWCLNKASHFERLILIYKNCIKYLLKLPPTTNSSEACKRQTAINLSMEMLKLLNEINDENQIIPYQMFYIPELKEVINIKEDYINLTLRTIHQNLLWGVAIQPGLCFSKYPFLFDVAAKCLLLQTDAALQMQKAFETACKSDAINYLTSIELMDPTKAYLLLKVNRSTIIEDTIRLFKNKSSEDLKKPLQVFILGEEHLYEPVIQKEFFRLILCKMLHPDFGMFELNEKSHLLWFNRSTLKDPDEIKKKTDMFLLIGVLCGLGIYSSTIITLPFPLALYKKLLKIPVTRDDLKELDPLMEKRFQSLLDYFDDDVEDKFDLDFQDIIPERDSEMVNHTNKREYVDLYVDYLLNTSVEVQFQAFREGFMSVWGGSVLDLCHPEELQAMVHSSEECDFDELQMKTTYSLGYNQDHPTIKMFWEVFHEMSLENKKKFLVFVTGSDRVPIFGMKNIQIQFVEKGEEFLPVALLCHNILQLPTYIKKETLKDKLLMAIQQTEGFGLYDNL
ncbi:E3 ubiquitin-protein ligase HERC4 [Biomphalaria glabrata]